MKELIIDFIMLNLYIILILVWFGLSMFFVSWIQQKGTTDWICKREKETLKHKVYGIIACILWPQVFIIPLIICKYFHL